MRIPGSKTAVPELPLEHIPRVALLGQLDRAAAGQIVVVSAPPGYGKTLLLAEWVRRSGGPGAAWVSLDHDDDDPRRFWAAVLAALRGVPGLPPDSALHRVGTAAVADGGDLVDELAEALDVLDPPVRLVLDDVHEVAAREPLRDLARLVRRRPRGLRLVLSSRVDPPLSLPRLRLEGRLHELRADRLRFGVDDAAALLRATGLDLTPAQVDLLHRRTDGWVAGLRLAALALRRSDDTDAFLAHFSGDERSVAEYLTGEVLSRMPRDAHDLLRAVSVCSRLPAELAVELTGRPDAGVLLEDLGHETAMVERTAHGGHRLHALLRSYLVASLKHRRPAAHRRLQVTAARWWADRGEAAHALRHAERAGDSALLAELLRRSGVLLLLNGELAPLRRSLAVVGPAGRAADPWLALIAAITHLGERELPAAAAELAHARRAWPATPDPSLDALRTSAELLAAGMGLPVVAQPETTTGPGSSGPEMVALLHVSRGAAGLAAGADGFDAARTELELALELARRNDLAFLEVQSLSLLAMLAGVQGDHRGMVAAAEDAVAAAARCGRHPSAWSAGASAMLAYHELLAGDPSAARARAAGSLDTADPLPPETAYTLHVVHGTALADQGERARGLAETRAARADVGDPGGSPAQLAALAVLEHRTALLHGNHGAAAEVAQWLERRVGRVGEVMLLHAWTEAAAGRHEAARTAVAPLRSRTVPALLPHTGVEVHLVEAEAALSAGDPRGGWAALDAALAEGEVVDVVRPFALAGPRTRELLATRSPSNGNRRFAARVDAARAAVLADAASALSERELVVLELLPSLLNAGEIAAELTVSVNTVKSHIRSIYAKLAVSTRRDAVQRAHERGLLP